MARDGITLDDVTRRDRRAATLTATCIGLPCCNVSNMLLYRRDLLDRYGLPVPQSWDELKTVGLALQDGRPPRQRRRLLRLRHPRRRRRRPFGLDDRQLPRLVRRALARRRRRRSSRSASRIGGARRPMSTCSRRWRRPTRAAISFVELLRDFRRGARRHDPRGRHASMPTSSATIPALAEKSRRRPDPGRPGRARAQPLRPPWAIPAKSKVRDEAWELAKFLCVAAPAPRGRAAFGRDRDLLAVASSTAPSSIAISAPTSSAPSAPAAPIACEERPFGTLGIEACVVVGDAVNAALEGRATADEALTRIEAGLSALAAPF